MGGGECYEVDVLGTHKQSYRQVAVPCRYQETGQEGVCQDHGGLVLAAMVGTKREVVLGSVQSPGVESFLPQPARA